MKKLDELEKLQSEKFPHLEFLDIKSKRLAVKFFAGSPLNESEEKESDELLKKILKRSLFKTALSGNAQAQMFLAQEYLYKKDSNSFGIDFEIPVDIDSLTDDQVNELYKKHREQAICKNH